MSCTVEGWKVPHFAAYLGACRQSTIFNLYMIGGYFLAVVVGAATILQKLERFDYADWDLWNSACWKLLLHC